MAFNPTNYSFPFLQGYPTAPLQVEFIIPDDHSDPKNIQVVNYPNWLTVTDLLLSNDQTKITFTLSVNESVASGLAEGQHEADVKLQYKPLVLGFQRVTYVTNSNPLKIFLNVTKTTQLTLSPSTMSFRYLIGGSLPQNQTLSIQSDSNWNVEAQQTWVVLSSNSGYQNGQVFIGVDPSGLSVGTYQSTVKVKDNLLERFITVTLEVTDGNTDNNYLYVTRDYLRFISEEGIPNTSVQSIKFSASHNWTAVVSESWLVLSAGSGASGVQSIDVSVDSDELPAATTPYLASIVFNSNGIQRTVYVELYVVEFLVEGIENEGLYFADDRNKLSVSNINPNMFLRLFVLAATGYSNARYTIEAPYQNGIAKAYVGLETNDLLKTYIPTDNFTSRIKNSIKPILMTLNAVNINKTSGSSTEVVTLNNVRFLTGKTPTIANKLCYTPNRIYMTNKGKISLTVLATETPDEIVISGDYVATFSSGISQGLYVYNAIIDLSSMALVEGNEINIAFGGLSVDVQIKGNQPESTMIAFENEWREYEFFEMAGFVTEEPESDPTTTVIQVEGSKTTKTVEVDLSKDFTVNTGFVYSQNEVDWLAKMLTARRVFLYKNSKPVEVILETKRLKTYETRNHLPSFNLKFKSAVV